MDELGPDEQKWLDVLRAADEPREVDRARVRASVLASIGAAGVAGVASGAVAKALVKTAAAATTDGAVKMGLFAAPWKIGVVVVSVVALGGGATVIATRQTAHVDERAAVTVPPVTTARETAPSSPVVPAVDPSALPTVAAPVSEPPAVAPKAVARAPARPASHGAVSSSREDVEAELALLTQAQQALKRGEANVALQALGRHAREHPRGTLAVEREGLRAIASCEAKRAEGRALAERFVAANPQSPLVARVRATCLSPPP